MNNLFKELEDFDEQSREILMGYKDSFLDFTDLEQQGYSSLITNKLPLLDEQSPFKDSPFGQYWEKRIPKYAEDIYGQGLALGQEPFRIFDLSKKMSQTMAKYYESLISENWDDIKFKVFANPNGEEVLKQYANTDFKPTDNEILFLIETNDGKFDFGKIVRVKLGKNAIEKIRFQFPFLNQTNEEELAKIFTERAFEVSNSEHFLKAEKELNADAGEIKDLLVKAIKYEYQNKKFDDMAWFTKILQGADFLGFKIPELLFEKSAKMRTKKFEEDKYWNAHLEEGFTPAFLPGVVDPKSSKDIKDMMIQKIKTEIEELTKTDNDDSTFDRVFKQIYKSLLLNLLEVFTDLLEKGVSEIEKLFPNEENLDYLYSSHAFLVGLWNGCIEFVASIVDLVALFMIIERDGLGFTVTDALFEKFENLLNIAIFNFPMFIEKLWEKLKIGLTDFQLWYLKYGENKYYWYKELGELTPDIITIVVPVLKGGKLGKVGVITKETSEELNEKAAKELADILAEQDTKELIDDAFKKREAELEDRIPKEIEIDEVEITNKKGLEDYEKAGLLSRTSKVYQGLKYEVLIYSDRISWKVLDDKFIWDNHTRLWGGELEFDFNTYGIKGLGQQWTNEAFEIFGNRIKTIKVEWKQLPDYPEGESLGYKQFYEIFEETYNFEDAVKGTQFYETMRKKGYQKIDGYEAKESVIVILKK